MDEQGGVIRMSSKTLRTVVLAGSMAIIIFALGLVTVKGGALLRSADRDRKPAETAVQRGEYLVKIMGCNDCHTPWKMGPDGPEPDMSRMLSGHPEEIGPLPNTLPAHGYGWSAFATNTAFSGPWGVSYTFNLTPDQNTGLGIWTEDMFVNAIRTGRHMGVSRPINPPMPWPAYRNAADEDLKAVYAYLRTIKPIVNHVPAYEPPRTETTSASK
jgi:mono/diheme cytochrome c family protein